MKYAGWLFLCLLLIFRLVTYNPGFQEGQKIRIRAKITSDPIKYSFYQSFWLAGLKLSLPAYPEVSYGDLVVVEGRVEGKELKEATLVSQEKRAGYLVKLREKLLNIYKKSLPQPHASLLAGVVLGVKSGIPDWFWQALKKSGTAHVVVASGMNVSLVASFLVSFLVLIISRQKAIPFALAGIWIYAAICGMDAPIIRAAIMGSIAFSAQAVGRITYAWKGLFLSAMVMLFIKPVWFGDIGFILSFTATASILAFEPKVKKIFAFLPQFIRGSWATALAAQLGVAPILFLTFGQYSLWSPLINTLVAWTIAPMTVIAGLAGIIGLAWPALGKVLVYLAYPLTYFFIGMVNFFSR